MSKQILSMLERKMNDFAPSGAMDAEIRRNALKEELQYYVLNFIYHHADYDKWIMYGGSALRIIHGLDRMSVDLDFEIAETVTDALLNKIKEDVENHFIHTYGASHDFLTVKITRGRGLILKFTIGDELHFGHPSNQVHIKIDLNHFVAPKTVTERRPINRDQMSFVVLTYNMSALMASKIAAIFLRGTRGVGASFYEEKGRDIYDLLWYMGKKAIPDFDYLIAKGIEVKDPRTLFDKITLKMNKVNNENLKQDLSPLFIDRTFIEHWLKNWRESYLRLLEDYKIHTIKNLEQIVVNQDFHTDNIVFYFYYHTEDVGSVKIVYHMNNHWIDFDEGDLTIDIDKSLGYLMDTAISKMNDHSTKAKKLKTYVTLFYQKTENYFKKTNRVMLGDSIETKIIRMTADNLNQKEQIVLNKSALLSCELDDLFK